MNRNSDEKMDELENPTTQPVPTYHSTRLKGNLRHYPGCGQSNSTRPVSRRARHSRREPRRGLADAARRGRRRLDCVSAGKNFNRIRRAICSGFFFHAARKDPQVGPRARHPTSVAETRKGRRVRGNECGKHRLETAVGRSPPVQILR